MDDLVEDAKNIAEVAKETGIPNLRKEIEEFEARPSAEGKTVKGTRRTTLRLLIPNLMFGGNMDMGDNVWVYLGEYYPAYCIYEDQE